MFPTFYKNKKKNVVVPPVQQGPCGGLLLVLGMNLQGQELPDTIPPSAPIFSSPVISESAIDLSWSASIDNVGVTSYSLEVSTDNATWSSLYSGLTRAYSHTSLAQGVTYYYRVRASDAAGNLSSFGTTNATTAVNSPATFIIPTANTSSTRTFDGTNLTTGFNGSAWVTTQGTTRLPQAGDIIELAAGQHVQQRLTFQNISGSIANRIIVRGPQTGTTQAVVRRLNVVTGDFVWRLKDCSNMTIDGYLPTAGNFTTAPYRCGIKVTYAVNAVAGLGKTNKDGPSQFIMWGGASSAAIQNATLQFCEIDGGWAYATPAQDAVGDGSGYAFEGIGVKIGSTASADGTWNDTIKLLNNWVHATQGEGMYQGSNAYSGNIPIRNHEIAFNLIEDCGAGAIHQKVFLEGDNRCHHNLIRRCGLNAPTPSRHAITHQLTTCRTYNNWIEHMGGTSTRLNAGAPGNINIYTIDSANTPAPGGLFMGLYGPYTTQEVWAYNNVIIRGGNVTLMNGNDPSDGINVSRDNLSKIGHTVYIFNNTILDNYGEGISVARADGGFIKNNIVRGNQLGEIQTIGAVPASNNNTSTATSSLFVNYGADDFRLASPGSYPASGTLGVDIASGGFGTPRTDQQDTTRPIGGSSDIGAYEG